jgi:hypothetical protein
MFNAYTEDQLVEQPAIGLFAEHGLIERLTDRCHKVLIYNNLLFK